MQTLRVTLNLIWSIEALIVTSKWPTKAYSDPKP